ncbi:putative efflux protein, MATE family [Lachnospiraceae bacterium NE2001]|nr:putative efflux protein, MATE family [Lachnospiraceae bacterium NE2001]
MNRSKDKSKEDLQFYKKVFVLAMPIAIQSFITIGVNMLDTMMVGTLGDNALSATSLANSFISVFQIFCMGLGMGASVLVSRYWGMKLSAGKEGTDGDATRALKQTVCLMLRLNVSLAALFALATLIMPGLIMRMYTEKPHIIELGVVYFRYSVLTYFFVGISLVVTIVLRSVGQVLYPLVVSIVAFAVNLCMNYIFIFGKFGAPKMGVAGAALGTLIARIVECTLILTYLFIFDKKICFRVKDLFMKTRSLLREYIRVSIPVLISDGILAIGTNSVAMVIGHLDETFIAANAITSVTQQLSTVVISGVSQAGAIVTGITLGEGDKEKTMRQGYQFFRLGLFLGLLSAAFIFFFSDMIIGFYKNASPETAETAKHLMDAICLIIVFQGTNSIMTKGVIRGGGDTTVLMLADNIFLWVLAIPLGILAGFYLKLPPFWVYICLKSDQIVKTFWAFIRLRSGKWIKKISTGDNSK